MMKEERENEVVSEGDKLQVLKCSDRSVCPQERRELRASKVKHFPPRRFAPIPHPPLLVVWLDFLKSNGGNIYGKD